jgi:hypothetical protein
MREGSNKKRIINMDITESDGYKRLLAAVEEQETDESNYFEKHQKFFHDYRQKLDWVIERAKHYADVTGLDAGEILTTWEKSRSYWFMNFYQEANQPKLDTGGRIRIFDTTEDLLRAIGKAGFRCPRCGCVSTSPYECNSGAEMEQGLICDWKVYGLLTDLGRGVFIFVKEKLRGQKIFMPVSWEKIDQKENNHVV